MAVTICIPLFSRPAWELYCPEQPVTPADLRRLGDTLHGRLSHAAELVERLSGDGWAPTVDQDGLTLTHADVVTAVQARRRLRALGINPNVVEVDELAWAYDEGVGD
jgi:hypothetical protein